jgi:hypothetical protein
MLGSVIPSDIRIELLIVRSDILHEPVIDIADLPGLKCVDITVIENCVKCFKLVKIRYVYTGQKKDLFSYWLTVKVR